MHTTASKADLRKHFIRQRQQLSPEQKQSYSKTILEQLSTYLSSHHSDALLMYYALSSEVDTRPFFSSSHTSLYAPRMLGDADMQWYAITSDTRWKQGSWGVLEPENGKKWQASTQKTVLICPLVSFDRLGNRLGMGKGCFDRWLDQNSDNISTIIGLSFACQESAVTMPTEAHDKALDIIITEQEIITCRTF